jgi:hypothetical protein
LLGLLLSALARLSSATKSAKGCAHCGTLRLVRRPRLDCRQRPVAAPVRPPAGDSWGRTQSDFWQM